MKRFLPFFAAIAAACAALPAVADDAPAAADPEAAAAERTTDPEEAFSDLFAMLQEKFEAGDQEGVVAGFKAALADPVHAPNAPRIFSIFLGYLLQTSQLETAKSEYLAALRTDPTWAEPCSGYIYGYLMETGEREAALEWVRTLLAQDLPEPFRVNATEWLASGLFSSGDRAGAFVAATNGLASFPAESFAPALERFAQSALAAKDVSIAEDLLAALAGREGYEPLAATLRLRLLGAQGKFAEAAAALPGLRGVAPDAQLLRALRSVFAAARAAKDDAGLDAVAAVAVENPAFKDASGIRLASAREWLGVPLRGAAGPAGYAERLDRLLALDFPPSHLYGLYTRYFYDVIGDTNALRSVAAAGRTISARLDDDTDRQMLRIYGLDAEFLLGNYDAAIELLEAGIPDHDPAWHEMMETKVLAHAAEAKGDWAGAAKLFGDFLAKLPEEEQTDPTSGIVFSRSTLVGNNQRRIAALWDKAGEPAKASAARAAAKTAYESALKANLAGRETADYIENQLRTLAEETAGK